MPCSGLPFTSPNKAKLALIHPVDDAYRRDATTYTVSYDLGTGQQCIMDTSGVAIAMGHWLVHVGSTL